MNLFRNTILCCTYLVAQLFFVPASLVAMRPQNGNGQTPQPQGQGNYILVYDPRLQAYVGVPLAVIHHASQQQQQQTHPNLQALQSVPAPQNIAPPHQPHNMLLPVLPPMRYPCNAHPYQAPPTRQLPILPRPTEEPIILLKLKNNWYSSGSNNHRPSRSKKIKQARRQRKRSYIEVEISGNGTISISPYTQQSPRTTGRRNRRKSRNEGMPPKRFKPNEGPFLLDLPYDCLAEILLFVLDNKDLPLVCKQFLEVIESVPEITSCLAYAKKPWISASKWQLSRWRISRESISLYLKIASRPQKIPLKLRFEKTWLDPKSLLNAHNYFESLNQEHARNRKSVEIATKLMEHSLETFPYNINKEDNTYEIMELLGKRGSAETIEKLAAENRNKQITQKMTFPLFLIAAKYANQELITYYLKEHGDREKFNKKPREAVKGCASNRPVATRCALELPCFTNQAFLSVAYYGSQKNTYRERKEYKELLALLAEHNNSLKTVVTFLHNTISLEQTIDVTTQKNFRKNTGKNKKRPSTTLRTKLKNLVTTSEDQNILTKNFLKYKNFNGTIARELLITAAKKGNFEALQCIIGTTETDLSEKLPKIGISGGVGWKDTWTNELPPPLAQALLLAMTHGAQEKNPVRRLKYQKIILFLVQKYPSLKNTANFIINHFVNAD